MSQKKKKRWRRREGGQGAIWISKNAHSSLITHYSITHHLLLKISQLPKVACLALVSNFDNKKILLFVGPIDWLSASFTSYFLFLFFLQPPIPKLTEPSEKEWAKKKPNPKTQCENKRKEEKKKKRIIEKPSPDLAWKKKKKTRPSVKGKRKKKEKEE